MNNIRSCDERISENFMIISYNNISSASFSNNQCMSWVRFQSVTPHQKSKIFFSLPCPLCPRKSRLGKNIFLDMMVHNYVLVSCLNCLLHSLCSISTAVLKHVFSAAVRKWKSVEEKNSQILLENICCCVQAYKLYNLARSINTLATRYNPLK